MRVMFVCDLSSALLLATPIKIILDQCCCGRLDIRYMYICYKTIECFYIILQCCCKTVKHLNSIEFIAFVAKWAVPLGVIVDHKY